MGKLNIRMGVRADFVSVRNISEESFRRWIPSLGRRPAPMDINYERAIAEKQIVIGEVDGQPVAFIKVEKRSPGTFVDVLAVSPANQRTGYGRTMLSYIERQTARIGGNVVSLKTVALYFENLVFYNRSGYLIDQLDWFDGFPVYSLSKQLNK